MWNLWYRKDEKRVVFIAEEHLGKKKHLTTHASDYGTPVFLEMPKDSGDEMKLGEVLLTRIGQELAPICGSKPVDGFLEYVIGKWKDFKYLPKDKTEQKDTTKV